MKQTKLAAMLVIAVMISTVAAVMLSDGSEGARSDVTARVFTGDGTSSGTSEYSGTGSDIEGILTDALSDRIVVNPNGTVKSLDGVENTEKNSWSIFQWRPPTGWEHVLANSTGDAYLDEGTSYYVYFSDMRIEGGEKIYSIPASFEPVSTMYFFIMMKEDLNANDYVKSILTEEQRRAGFWISGSGSDAAQALVDACQKLRGRGNTGFELEVNDDRNHTLYGWIGSFMGLEDDPVHGTGNWDNWSQFCWNSDTGKWEYNQWCLGYYDPGVYQYLSIVRQVTEDDSAVAGTLVTPSDLPSCVKSDRCTVRFVDGNGTVTTQTVPYFGSATAPSNPVKDPENGVTYTFTGWDREFGQVVSDMTVTAQFSSSGTPVDPEEPEVPGDEGVHVTGIKITASKSEMQAGESFRFVATVAPANAENKKVTWSTSNPAVLSVDQDGNVRAVSEGTATITVTTVDGNKTAFTTVKVSGVADSISLSSEFIAMKNGDSVTLIAITSNGAPVTWGSSAPSVATVDRNGKVTIVSDKGSAVITASSGDLVASCKVVVISEDDIDEITRVDISGSDEDSYVIQFTESHMEALEDAGAGYTVVSSLGVVNLSNEALSTIGGGGNLRVAVVVPTEGQVPVIGDSILYEYTVNNGSVSQLGGIATVTMPYALPSGADADSVVVCQIDPRGNILERLDCKYSDGYVTFETTHFSTYFATVDDTDPGSEGDGGSDAMVYVGIAAVIIVVALAAVLVVRRNH